MAYIVGLLTTDGCLISGQRKLNFKSEDEQLVRTFLRCLGRPMVYGSVRTQSGNVVHVAQFADARFYEWLRTVGLSPRKSLVLGPIDVPDALVFDCARGLLDGDGSIVRYSYDGTGNARGKRYEALRTQFTCGSRPHLDWLRARLDELLGIRGSVHYASRSWRLTYAIRASTTLLRHIYPGRDVPKLERKWETWLSYALRYSYPATASEADPTADRPGRDRTVIARIV